MERIDQQDPVRSDQSIQIQFLSCCASSYFCWAVHNQNKAQIKVTECHHGLAVHVDGWLVVQVPRHIGECHRQDHVLWAKQKRTNMYRQIELRQTFVRLFVSIKITFVSSSGSQGQRSRQWTAAKWTTIESGEGNLSRQRQVVNNNSTSLAPVTADTRARGHAHFVSKHCCTIELAQKWPTGSEWKWSSLPWLAGWLADSRRTHSTLSMETAILHCKHWRKLVWKVLNQSIDREHLSILIQIKLQFAARVQLNTVSRTDNRFKLFHDLDPPPLLTVHFAVKLNALGPNEDEQTQVLGDRGSKQTNAISA